MGWVRYGLLALLLVTSWQHALAVPEKQRWAYWDQSDESSRVTVDHSTWQQLLDAYLRYSESSRMYLFLYSSVKKADYQRLQDYLKMLSGLDPRKLRRREQLAYWINLYNALTVDLILRNYPIKSITKLGKGWFRTGPWDDEVIEIQGKSISLNDIEHRILRPIWDNPRVHYTINCASLGCPDLAPETYQPEKIEVQLEEAARRFVNQDKGANFVGRRLFLSKIYTWYQDDFGGKEGVWKELLRFARPELQNRLANYKGRLSYHYDWKLNEYRR